MTAIIQNPRQFLFGFMAIGLGILVYIAFRPSWQTLWATEMVSLDVRKFQSVVELGNNLPSLLHVVGLSLLTAAVFIQKKWIYMVICGSWFLINLAFEFLQSDVAYTWLNDRSINHDILDTIVQWLKNYSLHAVYDLKDILALLIGAVLAYIMLIKTSLALRQANKTT